MNIALNEFSTSNPTKTHAGDERQIKEIVSVWNRACGSDWPISTRFAAYNLQPSTGVDQRCWLASNNDSVIGFVIASRLRGEPALAPPIHGWINAIAVAPDVQRNGIGQRLLAAAENWLHELGCTQVQLGASLQTFAPGLPITPPLLSPDATLAALTQLGYRPELDGKPLDRVWDVTADLSRYEPPASLREVPGAVHPATPGQEALLLDFLRREFPGRWHYECEEFLRQGGRISDFMLLWTESGVEGFCWLTFEDSRRPLERYYPYQLPKPWGQLGPVGVSERVRGQGFGVAVMDAGLRRLRNNGVNGCVIDWTRHLDFYAKFGFEPQRAYQKVIKTLAV